MVLSLKLLDHHGVVRLLRTFGHQRLCLEVKKQANLVLKEHRKRRRSSASSTDKPFQQFLKGFETVVYEKALLMAECAALRAENQHQKKKRARKTGYIQPGGPIIIQDGQDSASEARS